MAELQTKYIDISPHKSILIKISQTGYSFQEAISELIDNAIDARFPGKKITIHVEITKDHISVSDNGKGMTEQEAATSIRLGFSEKKGQLGEFGLGLKTSTAFLGKAFILNTKPLGTDEEYRLSYDEDDWLKNGSWSKYPLVIATGMKKKTSGTTVVISKLKTSVSEKQIEKIREELGVRFGPFIKNKELDLYFNGEKCLPFVPKLLHNKREEFSFTFKTCKAWGWWGYQLSGLNKSYFGFHTYRRGRLVTIFDKIGLSPNQDIKQIIGELHIEGVPITHDKKGWLQSSSEYKEIETTLWNYFKPFEQKPRRILSGFPVSPGKVMGKVKKIDSLGAEDIEKEIAKVKKGDIIVTEMTRPQFLLAIRRCAGIVTNLGGNLCHAAIVAREFNIPAVVGTQIATDTLKENQEIILDGVDGYIYEE